MKRQIFLLLLIISFNVAFAQSESQKKVTDTFIMQFNAGDFEAIYQSFSTKMQNARTKKYYFDFFSMIKKEQGNILLLEILEYKEYPKNKSRGWYNGHTEKEVLDVKISVDGQSKIIGIYIKKKNLV